VVAVSVDLAEHDVLQILEIEDHSGLGIGIALQSDLENVVVAMAVRVGARTVERLILLGREFFVTADVRCGEFGATGDVQGDSVQL